MCGAASLAEAGERRRLRTERTAQMSPDGIATGTTGTGCGCSSHAPRPRAPVRCWLARRAGFTLLELLIVITMMIFITTVTVMNYSGAMRAAGYSAVSNDVFSSLLQARQRACLDNKPVYFYLLDGTNYVLQEALGTVAHIDPIDTAYPSMLGSKVFYDPYFDASAFSSNTPLIDIDRPGTGAIVWMVQAGNNMQMTNPVTLALYPIAACMLHVTNNLSCDFSHWQEGDHYGASLFAPQMLPKGFVFTPDPLTLSQTQRLVLFQADGSVDTTDYLSQLVVQEVISGKQMKFTISSNGKITQGQ